MTSGPTADTGTVRLSELESLLKSGAEGPLKRQSTPRPDVIHLAVPGRLRCCVPVQMTSGHKLGTAAITKALLMGPCADFVGVPSMDHY